MPDETNNSINNDRSKNSTKNNNYNYNYKAFQIFTKNQTLTEKLTLFFGKKPVESEKPQTQAQTFQFAEFHTQYPDT